MYANSHEAIQQCKVEGRCVVCGEKFSKDNTFTDLGWLETRISGVCERDFDSMFEGMDDED